MSQNTPAKHERIERHLMRQRGAGTRAVQADFGFSFEGFSAPASQSATIDAPSNEPPAKRRKTEVEIVQAKPNEITSSNAVVGGRTKQTVRPKRRFVAEEVAAARATVSDGEDSFVAGVDVKKRKPKRKGETDSLANKAQYETAGGAPGLDTSTKTRRTTRKPPAQRKQVKARVEEVDNDVAPAEMRGSVQGEQHDPKVKQGTTKKTTTARNDELVQVVDQQTRAEGKAPIDQAPPKTKPRATRRTLKAHMEASRHAVTDEQTPEEPPVEQKRKRRAPRKTVGQPVAEVGIETEKQLEGLPAVEAAPWKGAKKARSRAVNNDQTTDNATQPSHDIASEMEQEQRPAGQKALQKAELKQNKGYGTRSTQTKAALKRARPTVDEDNAGSSHPWPPPAEKLRATGERGARQASCLKTTPPLLVRRPLAETDANRSPSPRKSPVKRNEVTFHAPNFTAVKPSKRKRKDGGGAGNSAAGIVPQQNRTIAVEQDSRDGGTGHRFPASGAKEVRGLEQASSECAVPVTEGQTDPAPNPDCPPSLARPEMKEQKPIKRKQLAAKTTSIERPSDTSAPSEKKDEDIDWLFDDPVPKTKATLLSERHNPKATAASRITELADIDLDDLLAHVATFAAKGSGAPTTVVSKAGKAGARRGR